MWKHGFCFGNHIFCSKMVTPALTNGNKEVCSKRLHCLQKPSAILLVQSNSELPVLPSQQQAITAFQAAEAARCAAEAARHAAETKLAIEAARALQVLEQ
jgi:hypothetical protein